MGGKYKAGGVISTHTFGYGYYQIYGKLYDGSAGFHQSFWTMGTNNTTLVANDQLPAFNQVLEIDGFEQDSKDGELGSNHHTYNPSNQSSIAQTTIPNPGGTWFTMGFEWRPDGISYYYNGTKVATKSLTVAPWNICPAKLLAYSTGYSRRFRRGGSASSRCGYEDRFV